MSGEPEAWEAEILAQRAEEDRLAEERHRAQIERADLTPLTPAPGGWVAETTWQPIAGYTDYNPGPTRGWHEDFRTAQRTGMQMACCAGALAVRVIGPNGTVHCTWDREGNYWLRHSELAEADHRRVMDEIHAEMLGGRRRATTHEN